MRDNIKQNKNMGIFNGLNQKTIVAIAAVLIIIIGGIYYFRNNYNSITAPENGQHPIIAQSSNQISIKNFAFNPAVLNISVGDTVAWINNDSAMHTIQGSRIQMSSPEFQSGNLSNGQSYSFTFTAAGIYDYICSIHPAMKGTIIVK